MRLTEKSQVTIPKPIRDKLGIGPGNGVLSADEIMEATRGPFDDVDPR